MQQTVFIRQSGAQLWWQLQNSVAPPGGRLTLLFFFSDASKHASPCLFLISFNFQSATCLWSTFNVQKSLVREWWTMQSAWFVWLRQWVVLRRLWSDSLSKMGNEKKRPELPFNYPTIHHVACTNIRRHRWDLVFKFKGKKNYYDAFLLKVTSVVVCFFNQIWEKWFVKDSGVCLSSPHIPPLARLILLPPHVHSVDLICGISPSSLLEAHLKWRVSHDSQMCSICFLYPLQEFDIWKICTDLKKRKFENDYIVWQVEM